MSQSTPICLIFSCLIISIREGAFGDVLRARNKWDGIEYAIKRSKNQFRGPSQKDHMLREVHALAALANGTGEMQTPHIVRYYNTWCEDERLYIQMELCEKSLENVLYGTKNAPKMALKDILLLTRHMLLALDAVHKLKIVHLDIKPGNIFIKGGQYKLGDL